MTLSPSTTHQTFPSWIWDRHRGRHILLLALLVVIGSVAGAVVGRRAPVTYESEVRLAVGPESFLSQSVPGYTEATKTLASNYARYIVDSNSGAHSLARQLGVPASDVVGILASPIADSNVVVIEVEAVTSSVANRGADRLARSLTAQVNAPPAELPTLRSALRTAANAEATLDARFAELSRRSTEARNGDRVALARRLTTQQIQVRTDLALATARLQSAQDEYKSSLQEGVSQVTLQTIRQPTIVSDSRAKAQQWGVIAGAAAGVALTVLLLLSSFARSRRRATQDA